MAVLAQLVKVDNFKQMSRTEQGRVEDWAWAEFFGSLPDSFQLEILQHPKIKEHITGLVAMCVFGQETGGESVQGVDLKRTPLGRPEAGEPPK
jgi:hypothetical protein